MADDNKSAKVTAFINALKAKFEAKANKKTDISGDFSEDNESYPTVKATKKYTDDTVKTLDDSLATVAKSGSYSDLTNKPDLDDLGGNVTVEKQETAEDGFASTYVIKQNGVQVGQKINIMKDKMLRSISVETVGATPTSEESAQSLNTGDKYIKMVVETADNDGTTNLILPISEVFDLQTADESTLTLQNGVFSVKENGIVLNNLSTSIQTSLGYADNWNSSPAHGITAQDITNWNGKSELTTSDIDDEIEAYLDACTAALSS